jgi:tetratricopeptide (TPR) repeat protein
MLPGRVAQMATLILVALLGTAWADDAPEKLIAQGHYKRARPVVEAQLASNPGDARAQYLLSRIELEMGNVDAALPLAENAVAAEPSNSAYHVQLGEVVGVIADEAPLLSQIGLSRRFRKEIDLAVALDPGNTEALFDLMRYYVRAPAFFGGDKKKAHAHARQIATLDPVQGAFAFVHLAKADEEPEKIEGILRAAVDARPNDYVARARLAEYYLKHGPLDRAEEHAKAADLLEPDRTRACLLRAAIHLRREQWNEMEGTLSECEKRVPDDLSPYYRIATMLNARRQELARAEGYLRKYLTQEPEGRRASLARAWWRLGQNLQRQSREPEAVAAYERSLELESDSPAAKSLKALNPAARE